MTKNKRAEQQRAALENAFLAVDQVAEDLIRLIGRDLRYAAQAKEALQKIMKIKEDLIEVVQ